jgi:RimJ/RimL family protein N-acetyltransferase
MIPRKVMYEQDEGKLLDHFHNDIVDTDRYLRFGSSRSNDSVTDYVEKSLKDFGKENMWFIIEDNNKVVGTVHININPYNVAEMGFTVSPDYRGKGLGQHLFYRGATWAAMKGAKTIYTHCLSQNAVMQHIAKKNGMSVVTIDAGEKEASIKVNRYIMQAYFEDRMLDNIAFIDKTVDHTNSILRKIIK